MLGLSHLAVSLSWCSYMDKSFSPQESFSWRRAGRLWFFAIFPSLLFGAHTFSLYSPSWLILALHLLVRQVLISVSIPSTVPSYFLLVAKIEVTPSKCLFSLTGSGHWQVHLMRRGRVFLDPILHPAPLWGPIPLTSPSGDYLRIAFTKTLIFPLKFWSAEDRIVSQPFPLTPRPSIICPRHKTTSARVLGPDRVWAGL